jgi:hypothetical protein
VFTEMIADQGGCFSPKGLRTSIDHRAVTIHHLLLGHVVLCPGSSIRERVEKLVALRYLAVAAPLQAVLVDRKSGLSVTSELPPRSSWLRAILKYFDFNDFIDGWGGSIQPSIAFVMFLGGTIRPYPRG